MESGSRNLTDFIKQFRSELRTSYEELCRLIKLTPSSKKQYSVQNLFLDGGVDYLLKDSIQDEPRWQKAESLKSVFSLNDVTSSQWIIEGEPGSGKTLLTLQLAYEWCTCKTDSTLLDATDVDIFILIRMREVTGPVNSIYETIKHFVLSRDSKLSVDDIKQLLCESGLSVIFLLDGVDECVHSKQTDLIKFIVKQKLTDNGKVIITTRSGKVPKECTEWTNHVRLTGFNIEAQQRYVREVLQASSKDDTMNVIKEWVRSNPILQEFYQVPLFFSMYAHLIDENAELQHNTSMTKYFGHVIKCLHSHYNDKNDVSSRFEPSEQQMWEFNRLAFEGLQFEAPNPQWTKDVLDNYIGEPVLQMYLRIGILRESEIKNSRNTSSNMETIKVIQFYHSLYCDWYAAHYLADVIANKEDSSNQSGGEEGLEILEDLDPSTFQYLYRFACGINSASAKRILDHLNVVGCGDIFIILCILEQRGKVDAILDNVKEICSGTVLIRDQDTRVIQRSVLQLLDIAETEKIPVSTVYLFESFQSVDVLSSSIVLKSQLRVPILSNMGQLWFEQNGQEVSSKELDEIFSYTVQCENLKTIRFSYSLLPGKFSGATTLRSLEERNVQVLWYSTEVWYRLDLKSGKWQDKIGNFELTEEEYETLVFDFRDIYL